MVTDDLNPLYVFEAKISLLIRIAQTRNGAERLLEACLLPTLGDCEFLDSRPEVDQSFMGMSGIWPKSIPEIDRHTDQDSFLPSAIQRYHQLFMPTLQLVDGILATLGSSHANAAQQVCSLRTDVAPVLTEQRQALEFLSSHRDTVIILLKNDADEISLSILDEIYLLVFLSTHIFPQVPKAELVSTIRPACLNS